MLQGPGRDHHHEPESDKVPAVTENKEDGDCEDQKPLTPLTITTTSSTEVSAYRNLIERLIVQWSCEVPPGKREAFALQMRTLADENERQLRVLNNISSELVKQNTRDDLTNTIVRRLFFPNISKLVRAKDENQVDGVLFLYLDGHKFKRINDKLGHHVLDKGLKIISDLLVETIRGEARGSDENVRDLMFRQGDEFILVIGLSSGRSLRRNARSILRRIKHTINDADNQVKRGWDARKKKWPLRLDVGGALLDLTKSDRQDLLVQGVEEKVYTKIWALSEKRMYTNKRTGRGRHVGKLQMSYTHFKNGRLVISTRTLS